MIADRPGPDLMFQDELRQIVRRAYQAIAHGAGRAVVERFYTPEDAAQLPESALSWALGVGDPVRSADLTSGEVVLDLGCGGGIDAVLAARRVGPDGRVIGLDMLPEMCERARASAEAAGTAGWCEFHVGEMEALPLEDASVDVVLANGVLNLSPRKSRALAEAARVLRPGGRIVAADLTVERDLPPEVLASEAAWAGCIAGAVSEQVLARKLERVGFEQVQLSGHAPFSLDDVAQYPLFAPEVVELLRRVLPADAQQRVAVGLLVRARKPTDVLRQAAPTVLAARSGTRPLERIRPDAVEAPGVTVRHLKSVEDVQLKVLDVEPGGSTPFHTHGHAHEGVVISGSGTLRLDGRAEPLRPGDTFAVNPTDPHAIEADGPEPLRFVCMDCWIE